MSETKLKTRVKCQGRFHELREFLYENAFPLVTEGRTLLTEQDLVNLWVISMDDINTQRFDLLDPYYNNKRDIVRQAPKPDQFSLVPLIETPHYALTRGLIQKYCETMGVHPEIASRLESLCGQPNCLATMGKEPSHITMPGGTTLKGYVLSGNFGIGTLVPGGVGGPGVVSDAPFSIGISKQNPDQRNEFDLAAVLGFWAQGDELLVSQIQACRNAELPEEVPFGVTVIHAAECIAGYLGFKKVVTYGARTHPHFMAHPSDWTKLGPEFVQFYDNSAKKLKFDGGRAGYHTKDLISCTGCR